MLEFIAKQKSIYKFICKNVNYSQYLGEGANSNGKVQVYFRVKNRFGKDEIMVIALSDETFIPQLEFDDPRKVRSIITVYFRDIGDLNKIFISKEF
uniref:Uncharacterized protein n=1 Tax=Panagrolaimus davidi TaxID=227884 RepID=A0A914PXR2_9BILA